jgi:hypothetical protein
MSWYKIAQEPNGSFEKDITDNVSDPWFRGSVVVDQEGNPLKVYHGTRVDFDKFDLEYCAQGIIWFSSDKEKILSGESGACGSSFIKEAYLLIRNPAGWAEYDKYGLGELEQMGYDGIILDNDYVVFDPSQIKVIA